MREVFIMLHSADDRPQWTDDLQVLTKEQLNIPGLHMVGHADFHSASGRLDTHYHCNMEFVAVIKGRQQYEVNNKKYVLYGGDVFMTYPYEIHGNQNAPQDVCEFIWFQLDYSSPENFLGLSKPFGEFIYRRMINYTHRTQKVSQKELVSLRQTFELLSSKDMQRQILGYSRFLHFIMNNLCTDDISLEKDIYSPEIQESMTYIHAHLMDDLRIENIAQHCGLSASRFKARFKEEHGITPHAYIVSLKIDTAKVLLTNPEISVTEIAFRLNFSSSNHFATVFRKYTGYTPTDFRSHRFSNLY